MGSKKKSRLISPHRLDGLGHRPFTAATGVRGSYLGMLFTVRMDSKKQDELIHKLKASIQKTIDQQIESCCLQNFS